MRGLVWLLLCVLCVSSWVTPVYAATGDDLKAGVNAIVGADVGALDTSASGFTLTLPTYPTGWFAACIGASASLQWNDTGTSDTAPTAACNDTTNIQRPSADFSGSAVNSAELTFPMPAGWNTGKGVDLDLWYVTDAASPTGNVEWDISTVCRAVAEDWDGTFNAAQTITDAVGADEALNIASQSSLTLTGCAAGEHMTIKISRDGVNDTNNDVAKLMNWRLTIWLDL